VWAADEQGSDRLTAEGEGGDEVAVVRVAVDGHAVGPARVTEVLDADAVLVASEVRQQARQGRQPQHRSGCRSALSGCCLPMLDAHMCAEVRVKKERLASPAAYDRRAPPRHPHHRRPGVDHVQAQPQRGTTLLTCGATPMASHRSRSSVVITMTSTTNSSVDAGRRRARTVDRLRLRREPPLRDTAAPARRGRPLRRDDGSHTTPQGDAVLPRQEPAR
jgi:hypothetical protein